MSSQQSSPSRPLLVGEIAVTTNTATSYVSQSPTSESGFTNDDDKSIFTRKHYYELMRNRVKSSRIVSANVYNKEEGVFNVSCIRHNGDVDMFKDIKDHSISVPEWVELYYALKARPSNSGNLLLKRMENIFSNVIDMENKLKIEKSVIDLTLPIPTINTTSGVSGSRKRKELVPEALTPDDLRLDTSVPPNVVTARHGQVCTDPPGVFFQNLDNKLKFFRFEQLGLASSRMLLCIHDLWKKHGDETQDISLLLEEFNKRHDDPVIKKFRLDH